MIDEVHMLNDQRGATLEVVISRMKTISRLKKYRIRFVAISATVPNIDDVALWIGTNGDHFSGSAAVKVTKK
jgi:ATP-dependent DNA helicase HFM1/MER3